VLGYEEEDVVRTTIWETWRIEEHGLQLCRIVLGQLWRSLSALSLGFNETQPRVSFLSKRRDRAKVAEVRDVKTIATVLSAALLTVFSEIQDLRLHIRQTCCSKWGR
jgi:hypothetical protein